MVLVVPGRRPAAHTAAGAAEDPAVQERNKEPSRDWLHKRRRPRHVCGVRYKEREIKTAMGAALVAARGAAWACLMRPETLELCCGGQAPEEEEDEQEVLVLSCCYQCRAPGRS